VKIPYFRSEIESLTDEVPQLRYLVFFYSYQIMKHTTFLLSFLMLYIFMDIYDYIGNLDGVLVVKWQINNFICL